MNEPFAFDRVLDDGSVFFTIEGAREFAKYAFDLGVDHVEIVIGVERDLSIDAVSLKLDYCEKTGRGSRTRRTSSHVQNPEAFSIWASLTEVAS